MRAHVPNAILGLGVGLLPAAASAADAISGGTRQPLNVTAIVIFILFVLSTLAITYWAAKRSRSASDFYTAGGGITGFQNGLAVAGDYMSAATLLGITSLVYARGYDGFLYAISFFMGVLPRGSAQHPARIIVRAPAPRARFAPRIEATMGSSTVVGNAWPGTTVTVKLVRGGSVIAKGTVKADAASEYSARLRRPNGVLAKVAQGDTIKADVASDAAVTATIPSHRTLC